MCYLTTEEYQGHVLIGGLISNNSHPSDARATGRKKIEYVMATEPSRDG